VFAAPAADLGARSPAPVPVPVRTFDPQAFALWGQAFDTWGSTRSDRNAARLERDTGGFIIGADATFDGVSRVGIAGGFQRTTLDVPGRLSSGETDSVFAALYGGTALGPLNVRLGASYAGQQTDIRRAIAFPGFFDTARASYDGYTAQAFGELGYRFRFMSSVVEPFIGATALTVHRDGFAETGGPAALVGVARDHEVGFTTVGIRTEWQPFDAPLVVRGMTGWRHAFGDVRPTASLAFQAAVATPFLIAGVPLARDVLVGETALDWRVSDSVTLTVAYTGQLAKRASDNGVKGQFLVKF
jgi:outer membrane autotransporter protein